jgi:hypothetical protein
MNEGRLPARKARQGQGNDFATHIVEGHVVETGTTWSVGIRNDICEECSGARSEETASPKTL